LILSTLIYSNHWCNSCRDILAMKTASSCCCCLTVASFKNCSYFHCFKIQSLSILFPFINDLLFFYLTNLKLSLVIETVYLLLVTELIDMILMRVVGEYHMSCKLRMCCFLDVDNQSYYTHLIYDSVHSRCYLHSVCAWSHVDE
jgi:hypothetical protein